MMGTSVYELKSIYYWYSSESPVCLATEPPSQACYNCELKNTYQFFFFFGFYFLFFHCVENCTLWKCVNEISTGLLHIRHAVYVGMRECHIFAAFIYGPMFLWRNLVGSQGSENQPFFKMEKKWTWLMKVISFWCWGQVLILYSTSFSDCFIFKYIHCILNILFARIRCHWRTQTDILAKCVSVAKYLANTLWIPTLHRWCVESLQSLISVSLVFKMAQFTSDITKGPELLTAAEERLIRCGLLLLLLLFFCRVLAAQN